MSKYSMIPVLVVLLATPAAAARVTIDYDRHAELGSYHTFQYVPSKEHRADDQLMDERIVAALEGMLQDGGLEKADSNPDVFATYHINTQQEQSFTTTGMGYGMGAGWGRWGGGMGTATTTEQTWTDGTIIVDLWDAQSKKMIWRGTAEQTLKENPAKLSKQIQKAFGQMLAKWQEMRGAGD